MSNPVIEWASDNPLVAGVAAIGVVVVVMMLAGGGSSTTSGSDGGAVAAYYAAVGQQTQAGNMVQIAQIQANADTNKTLIAATYGLESDKLAAGVATQHDQLAANVAYGWIDNANRQTEAAKYLGIEQIASNERITADTHKIASAALGTKKLSGAEKAAVLQSAFTGQIAPVQWKPINPGNSTSAVISSIGGAVSSIGSTVGKLFGL